ncbi:MAG: zinc dependent phospholipase C family protein [Treponema sp.]|nr:zinc dependent phospholipase C family protein [Treponema sp.]
MPSQILHTIFGEDVIKGLYARLEKHFGARFGLLADKALEKISRDYRSAFVLGCQGPDIFYHNQRQRPVALEYGSLLHRRGYGMFTAGLLKMGLPDTPPSEDDLLHHRREKGINAMGTYAMGFMTHAVLDRCCHPYIIYRAERKYHVFFERILDVLMLKELRGQEAVSWDQNVVLSRICENPPLGLKELIARALGAAFPERTLKDKKLLLRIDNTFSDSARFYKLTAPLLTTLSEQSTDIEKLLSLMGLNSLALVFPEKLPTDIDFLNLKHTPWHYPYIAANSPDKPAADTRSFPEIYADAVETGIATLGPAIFKYLDTGIFPIAEAARSIGNTCLSIQDEEGKPCAPNLIDPLPLGDVLRQQGEVRGLQIKN